MSLRTLLPALSIALLLAPACTDPSGTLPDDDDFSTGDDDDDDDSADDDDATDDDDSAGDDDDDDDSAGDDDDSAQPPSEGMVDRTYCLDWDSVDIIEPAGGSIIIGIVGLDDFPLLLSPTAADAQAGDITMLMAASQARSCDQDLTQSTFNPTPNGPGQFTPPGFLVGPADMMLPTGTSFVEGRNLQLTGDFSADDYRIENSTISGLLDVTDYNKYCAFPLTCFACPWDDMRDCITLYAVDAVWHDTLAGPLVVIP